MSVQHNTGKTISIITKLMVLRKRVLRRNISRREGTVGWRKLQNEELYHLYASPNIKVMKAVAMLWAWHVVRINCLQISDLEF